MALLRTEDEWAAKLQEVEIPEDHAKVYAKRLVDARINEANIKDIDKETLKNDLQINIFGDILAILRIARPVAVPQQIPPLLPMQNITPDNPLLKAQTMKPPSVTSEMSQPQFRKFKIDWTIYKQTTGIQSPQLQGQLYNACEDSVQVSLINSITDVLHASEDDILQKIEAIVTKRANPLVHQMMFCNESQTPGDSIQEYVTRLRSKAHDCEYTCPNCQYDLQPINIRQQLIRGLHNETLHIDILAKAENLKSLEDVIKHPESFESAQRDHQKILKTSESKEVMAADSSDTDRYDEEAMRIKSNYQRRRTDNRNQSRQRDGNRSESRQSRDKDQNVNRRRDGDKSGGKFNKTTYMDPG